jgi:cephalosporin-C deacetylase
MYTDLPEEQLRDYRGVVTEPADFDDFWADTLAEARHAGWPVRAEPVATELDSIDVFDVTFAGFAGQSVRAWLRVPRGANTALPTVVQFAGYGGGRGHPLENLLWAAAGFAHLQMDTRGQGSGWSRGDTPDHGAAGPEAPGVTTRGIADPKTYYYRRLITDAVRAVEAVRALPGVDGARVAVVGNSQGGGLALAVAGLVGDLGAVLTTAPFLCDMRRAVQLSEPAPYGEIARYLAVHREAEDAVWRTLSYVDGVSFARRATAPAHFGIGLRDTVCPPSTGFAAYNQYGAAARPPVPPAREMHVYPFNGHEGGEAVHVRRQLRWLGSMLHPTGPSGT